ncbi:MAG: virulence RhuM family protein [Bacteroidales bacterium]
MESKNTSSEILFYSREDGKSKIEVKLENETVWLTQQQMAELFQITKQNVSLHIKNIYKEDELSEKATVKDYLTVQTEGKREVQRSITYYNLDVIISVGYRVKSLIGTHFRIWATQQLKEYIIKGFILDDQRLKQGREAFSKDYFRELLDRVRSIRASERRIWQQITDIFAECSIDYNKNSATTKDFYAMIQNKFHYAIIGQTAAEIIYTKANKKSDNMGLTTWKNSPDGRILKSDVTIAKNYLPEKEIRRLERAVTGYFDYIEDLTERENTFTMEEFALSVNEFLAFRKYEILKDKGKISKQQADKKAEAEYDEFNKTQKIISDFDKEIKKLDNK